MSVTRYDLRTLKKSQERQIGHGNTIWGEQGKQGELYEGKANDTWKDYVSC